MIFPYSATAIETLDCLGDKWKCIGFISDDVNYIDQYIYGYRIFSRKAFDLFPHAKVLAVHGSPTSFKLRREICDTLKIKLTRFGTVIHPKAVVSENAEIGSNVLVMAGTVITSNAQIQNHVIVLPNSVVHHDSSIGEYTLVAANVTISGNVQIGSNCYLGASSSFKNGIVIGDQTLVGIGSNVINSFPAGSTLVGNPAKILKK